ncbi:MAG TPA: C40 family peptidase [Dermatophilaceae bacterium]|nr:C40 family peptidase [Dermatophilaceae bacterium]
MAHSTPGRHRAPGRPNPLAEIGVAASRAGQAGAKASAVLVASGGLVAAFAMPATGAPTEPAGRSGSGDLMATAPAAVVPAAAPAVVAPAAVAPAATPVRPTSFGVVGVTAVAKPKPRPEPRPQPPVERSSGSESTARASGTSRPERTASRSTTRTTEGTTTRSAARRATAARSAAGGATAARTSATAPRTVAPAASGVVGIARGLLGIPYRLGGTTPAGFDCSGFTSYVFRQVGTSLPRTAAAQQAAASRVSDPRPGDLVFFGAPAYHVGIYTGPGTMIDSPRSGKSTAERAIWSSNVTYGRP